MDLIANAFSMPKAGNTPEECDDAFAYDLAKGCFSIADGATTSSFSREWAHILVNAFVATPFEMSPEWLKPHQAQWKNSIYWDELLWFAKRKALQGSHSTLLGLKISAHLDPLIPSIHWHAMAIGDCCLFHLRSYRLVNSFPISSPDTFNNHPVLLSTNEIYNRDMWSSIEYAGGECHINDIFLLMTDALGHWSLTEHHLGGDPWETLHNVRDQGEFEQLITCLREAHAIENDDVTFITITIT
jgi:hypothetical protein